MDNNRKSNQPIRLTEQDLHFLVEEAVKGYLVENSMDEGALWNAFKQKGQQIGANLAKRGQEAYQGVRNLGTNMTNTYRTGKENKKFQQYATNLKSQIENFLEMASRFPDMAELVKASRNYSAQIDKAMGYSNDNLANVSARTFSTNNYGGQQ